MTRKLLILFAISLPALAQGNTGELRLRITDPRGHDQTATITISSPANQYTVTTTSNSLTLRTLPYGIYLIHAEAPGFEPTTDTLELRSALPLDHILQLTLATVTTSVNVNASIIDPYAPSAVNRIGSAQIEDRIASLPGRSIQDLVDSQPGWLYEGNAVLHPRGSEYQTQFVVDGIPLTDNRSPGFGPEIEADNLDSLTIYTAGIPAEYGRKMGGIVELETHHDPASGLHGQLILDGGSYDTASGYGDIQQTLGRNTFGISVSGSQSAHYLNPVVPQNFTNRGTTADFSARYDRDLTLQDRLTLTVRHDLARYEIPNELLQQAAGQLQTADNIETLGAANYTHILSSNALLTLAGMVRDNANDLNSNINPNPIAAFQHNDFREGYVKATASLHKGHQELKAGIESDNTFLHENFNYTLTDPTQFDPGTPPALTFIASRPDLEQSAFVEDLVRLGNWTVTAGLRWDHYQLLLNQNAFSPRISAGRYFPATHTVLHASYDRIFQTPSSENILISSSPQIQALSSQFLRLPVQPSRGNYYEGGLTQSIADRLSAALTVYRRNVRNYADDDQLLNTGVSYPIAFDHAIIYGAEAKLTVVRLGKLTGFASYSYMLGNVWLPVTGGLFLGDDAQAAVSQLTGHFPDSQDQRHTLRTRARYQLARRLWLAAGASYGSGLPFDYTGDEDDALATYGPQVVNRLNFTRGRILPTLAVSASLGADIYKSDRLTTRFQADGENLNNRLNIIDFGGLFSGNAIAPGRSFALRLSNRF